MDADSISGTSVSPEVFVVEDVSHFSIALSWRTLQEERSSCPIDKWTRFAVDQMNPKTDTYKTIYVTVDVNVCEKLGLTPLMVAAQKGFTRMVHILVEHGADIHIKNASGKDALMLACFAGHLDIVMQLRQLGATWQAQDVAGCSPLHWAVDGGHVPVVTYMIQNGCEVDVRDNVSGWTPLMRVSAVTGNSAMAQLLIEAGADINARDKDGKTSLMIAVLNNYEQLVKLLLDSGADRHVTNENIINLLEENKGNEGTVADCEGEMLEEAEEARH
ncbi:fibronectin type 3 and ankyrin repeat domains protein 1 [Silurus asotus]|uniref:Fibronectin type 3 and ankyrin repeat domains protein 1 n=1 Tax=Silurus asotus TaxID=30991 RepID=A0AAD5FQ68_SILAS|nr:fibronectin type 3 and ankyrin repeat domains protein 1 [Silurus asotus]